MQTLLLYVLAFSPPVPNPDVYIQYIGTATEERIVSEATDYIVVPGTPIIDLTILPLSDGEYIRFIKNETVLRIWSERSSGGLFGT